MKSVAMAVLVLGLISTVQCHAGKVSMPKEGNYEFDYCHVGQHLSIMAGDKVFVSHYNLTANILTQPPGRAFDRMSSLCYGTFAKLNGQPQDFGICELTDQDGDKWWMEYHGNADGSGGSYTAVHGVGKYEGMTVQGQYTVGFWPTSKDVAFQGCNRNKGSYRLK